MSPEHKELLAEIKKRAKPQHREKPENDSYHGSGRPFYRVSVPDRAAIGKAFVAKHKADTALILKTVESLFKGASHEEKTLACILLARSNDARALVKPKDIDRWLNELNGWAEVDSLCQNLFTDELTSDWPSWKKLLERLSKSKNINKRRASLVLLTRPVHVSAAKPLAGQAFATIVRLQGERDILITKAISWLLRSLTTHHAKHVERFLGLHAETLPKIAIRETNIKLKTGTKSGRTKRVS